MPAVHKALPRWGAGDRGYVVVSEDGLEQRASARSRPVVARELAVRAGSQVVIRFENRDHGGPHNVAIFKRDRATRVFSGPTTVGETTIELRFTAPAPGGYLFWDEFEARPDEPPELVSVAPDQAIARWVPGLRTAAAGVAIDSHSVQPAGAFALQ